jgi:hypothetical protein
MTVFVNNIEVNLFSGARVIDAIRAYYTNIHHNLPDEIPVALDDFGNIVEMDGEISHLQRLYTIDHEVLLETDQYENF